MQKLIATLAIALFSLVSSHGQIVDAVLGRGSGTIRNNYSGVIGFKFTAVTNVTVVELGRFVVTTNNFSHTLYLMSSNMTTLAQVDLPARQGPTNQFQYASLTNSVPLFGGETYYVYSLESTGSDSWYDFDQVIMENSSIITSMQSSYGFGSQYTGKSFGPVSFRFFTSLTNTPISVTLAWDRNTETNIAGYRIWYNKYTSSSVPVDAGNQLIYTVTNLFYGRNYQFYATAYTIDGIESGPSATISYMSPANPNNTYPPAFVSQPISSTVAIGSSVTLSCNVTGTPPISFTWYKNNSPIQGATNTFYLISNMTTNNVGSYYVNASNPYGNMNSVSVNLSVPSITNFPPVFVTYPIGKTLNIGDSLVLSCVVTGTPPITLIWYKNFVPQPSQTSTNWIIPFATPQDTATYFIYATNVAGTRVSTVANVMVVPSTPPAQVIGTKIISTSPQ